MTLSDFQGHVPVVLFIAIFRKIMQQLTSASHGPCVIGELLVFRHAGVYTAEEIALVFRDKLIRLQSLYIDQFKRLHHRLREKRRQYLHTMRRTFPTPGDAS